MTSKTDATLLSVQTYQYDGLGNLKSVWLPSGVQITYLLDAHGRRYLRKKGNTVTDVYVYDSNDRVIATLDGQGNVQARYVYGVGANTPDYMIKGTNTYQIVSNHLGSPIQVINAADGSVSEEIHYDEWGNITLDSRPGFIPFGLAGGLYDQDTGSIHFEARDYDASTGRWFSKDPALFEGGDTNLYGYVLRDPVNFVDPSGLVLNYSPGSQQTLEPVVQAIKQTSAGRALINRLEVSPAIYTINVTNQKTAYEQGQQVFVDPTFHPAINTNKGQKPASTLRILAHELGHLTGSLDDGPGRMNNVNRFENPIACPVEGYMRTTY